ncbi:MAG: hypothetical protein ACPHBP_00560, partial [Flavobacteriaceae bacterium]
MKAYTQTLAAIVLLVLGLFSCQSETKQKNEITLGIQTYSFRTMEDQSPLAILDYVKQTGIKNIELMGNHAEPFAG